ncbi:MAG: LacI family transcriptional regulator [Bacilli bacterium]|jgi:LacI family transcriptional regulator|nr:LacI family transcriptional regulator [Bacilli bacterium]
MATIKDVAYKAGVSKATVSRYLNNKYVSDKTKKVIEDVIKDLNYVPNKVAQGLSNQKIDIIGIIVPDLINPFFSEIVSTIEKEAIKNNITCMILSSNNDINLEKEALQTCLDFSVKGIIIATSSNEEINVDIPIVAIDRCYLNATKFIGVDNKKIGHNIINYFVSNNKKKTLCILGPNNVMTTRDRACGIQEAALKNNIDVDIVYSSYSDVEKVGQDIIKNRIEEYDSIFLGNEMICLAFLKLGLKENILKMSIDGTYLSTLIKDDIKIIKQPIKKMAVLAYDKLVNWNNKIEETIIDIEG